MSIDISPIEIIRLHGVWTAIIDRCFKPKSKQYKNYGARGITVCDEWKDFNNFCRDVGQRPNETDHLDRIDNDGGYSKENCRWTSPKINHRNKRNNTCYETHLGKMCQSQLIEHIGFTRRQFRYAIQKYGIEEFLIMFKEDRLPSKRINPDLSELIGKKFGSLTVFKLDDDKSTGARYFCVCDCGRQTRTSRFKLLHGLVTHCISCARKGPLNPRHRSKKKDERHA